MVVIVMYICIYQGKVSNNVMWFMSSSYNDSPCDFISDVARVILSYKCTT